MSLAMRAASRRKHVAATGGGRSWSGRGGECRSGAGGRPRAAAAGSYERSENALDRRQARDLRISVRRKAEDKMRAQSSRMRRPPHRLHEDVQAGPGSGQAEIPARRRPRPEWICKGDGGIRGGAPKHRCPRPPSRQDGGEEPEVVRVCTSSAPTARPLRIGFRPGQ